MKPKMANRVDPALDAAQRYFEADAELDALNKARKDAFPRDLSEEEGQHGARAYWQRRCAEGDLASRTPKTVRGALAALDVVIDRLEGLEAFFSHVDSADIPLIIKRARKALQAAEAERRKAERRAAKPEPAAHVSTAAARSMPARSPKPPAGYAVSLPH